MEGKLRGQTALVTGGNTGIGAAICRALGSEGANVAINYVSHPELADGADLDPHFQPDCMAGDLFHFKNLVAKFSSKDFY